MPRTNIVLELDRFWKVIKISSSTILVLWKTADTRQTTLKCTTTAALNPANWLSRRKTGVNQRRIRESEYLERVQHEGRYTRHKSDQNWYDRPVID